MFALFRPALILFVLFTLLTGIAYPLATTGIAQTLFPNTANGSPLMRDGHVIGSALIGQRFTRDDYFWGRPSAAGDGYNARASSGSNLGPNSHALADRVAAEAARYGVPAAQIPIDLLTTSGSGLDPEISLAAARFQADRVAQARDLPRERVLALIDAQAEPAIAGIFGDPRVNVLRLNLALDRLSAENGARNP